MTQVKRVDVLIIGAGPAGLALANWFRNSPITVLLIDKKPGPTQRGAAEGLKSITNEIFDSYGIGPQIAAESWRVEEIAFWGQKKKDGKSGGGIEREQVIQDKVEELGKFRETTLQQARVEYHMQRNLLNHENINIQYNTRPIEVKINESMSLLHGIDDVYPVEVRLVKKTQVQSEAVASNSLESSTTPPTVNGNTPEEVKVEEERVLAKYIIGCDGAHSWLRKQLDVQFEGDLTDSVFGVVDLVPKSNFPDLRRSCYLGASTGTILMMPRANKEVRLYVPVESGTSFSDPKDLTLERIIAAARDIFSPYTLEIGSVSWWSAYRVGQRVGSHFSRHNERAFLVGDAVHTHSPKAGQGMNTSIQDAYNLGWKLRLVLQKKSPFNNPEAARRLLATYESERRPVAQDLISFDRGYLKLFVGQPSSQFDTEFLRGMKFTTGLSIRYPAPSCVVQLPRDIKTSADLGPSLVKADLVPGKRLPDFQAVYQADAVTCWIHRRMQATGQFRVLVFAGDIATHQNLSDNIQELGRYLGDESNGMGRLTAGRARALVEVLMIHSADRAKVELLDLPEVFRPWSDEEGYNYWRVMADAESAHEGHGRVYERLEIDPKKGRTLVVRPDGYIGAVLAVDDFDGLGAYFKGLGML
ncbi:FAD binding domain-containing protein [Sordaria brevicollis]|uniref:FAD binding domain-containing protein n=1 Tax=Sordaria brevicollis TaxID=83679 RepID=A0AAE0PI21_SORBR|nr:FAD binding domain-containing protein [Sordaria brevicollis]